MMPATSPSGWATCWPNRPTLSPPRATAILPPPREALMIIPERTGYPRETEPLGVSSRTRGYIGTAGPRLVSLEQEPEQAGSSSRRPLHHYASLSSAPGAWGQALPSLCAIRAPSCWASRPNPLPGRLEPRTGSVAVQSPTWLHWSPQRLIST